MDSFYMCQYNFTISIKDIQSRLYKYAVDLDESKIRYKRAMLTDKQDTEYLVSELLTVK